VENRSGDFWRDCARLRPLFPTADGAKIDAPLLGRVPFDPELAAACDRGAAPRQNGPTWQETGRVAARLVEAPERVR
jgi:hypothetical protein